MSDNLSESVEQLAVTENENLENEYQLNLLDMPVEVRVKIIYCGPVFT